MLLYSVVLFLLSYCSLSSAGISVTVEEENKTILIKATQVADKVRLSAVVESSDRSFRDNNISKNSELVLHYPDLDFRKGFQIAYTISYEQNDEKKFDVGTFIFSGGSLRTRRSSFYNDGPKFGWPQPGHRHLGSFALEGVLPSHGPPPFFKPAFPGHHDTWGHHHHHHHNCGKANNWSKIDHIDRNNENEVKPTTTTQIPTTNPESTTQPQIDIRFGNR